MLVWQAPSLVMNPTLARADVARAYAEDESAAAAEWGAEFRRDLEAFVFRETISACTVPGCQGLTPVARRSYAAFVDPSGGSTDSFTLAITTPRSGTQHVVLDYLAERRPPFSPNDVVAEYAASCKSYPCDRRRRRPLRG